MGYFTENERRSLENPRTPLSNPDSWLFEAFGASSSKAGVTVNETTALNLSAVWAAVRVLTDTVASIPIHVYERIERGKRRASDHPIHTLLHDRPNPEMSAFSFKEVLQGHLATRGNAYAEKERNGRGEVVALWPITPDRVTPRWVEVRDRIRKVFEVSVGGVTTVLTDEQVLHIPGFGYDGLQGYSPIRLAMESLSITKAAEEFGARLFGQGLKPSGVISHPGTLSEKAHANLRKSLEAQNAGLDNAHRLLILEEAMKWEQSSFAPEEAQFLELRKFQVVEIARWFKVPPHKIADLDRATFSNIEHQSIEFATDTARPWFVRWEQVLNWEMFSKADRGRYFGEFLMDALLRGDTAARGQFYTSLFNVGAYSQNDIREKENENPIDGGDRYYVQGALVPIDKLDEMIAAKSKPEPEPESEPEDGDDLPAARLAPVLRDAAMRAVRRETNAGRAAARKAFEKQADQLAFRRWVDEFYASADTVAEIFAPAMLALHGERGSREAERAALAWVAASADELRAVLRSAEAEQLPAAIDAVFNRWETIRADDALAHFQTREAA